MPFTNIGTTIPGAISTLQGYLNTVASQNPSLNVGVYLGEPIGYVSNNFMAVGTYQLWHPMDPDSLEWAAIPGAPQLIKEEYSLLGCIRVWEGNIDPLGRLAEAFTLLNGLHFQIRNDIGGSGSLSPSGSWGRLEVSMAEFGPIGDLSGYGVVLDFKLGVINAQISTS